MREFRDEAFDQAAEDISRAEYIKLYFGSMHGLAVRAVIFEYDAVLPEPFTMTNVKDKLAPIEDPDTGETKSILPLVVRTEMMKLKQLGMIANLSRTNPREVPYRRTIDPGWNIVPVALEALAIRFPEHTT
jgi:hypothetical protein